MDGFGVAFVGLADGFAEAAGADADGFGEPDAPGAASGTASRTADITPSFVAQTSVDGASGPDPSTTYIPRTSSHAGLPPARRYCSMNVPLALS